ncbi:hypothetical protein [Antarcticirhabdus aurantiaca]|uniref:hypothetical protein n=1 Tax=Antarcticirhabdus aurantiaca TaxID=2606717 RepID=UPI00131B16DE|nr:hypothetical protein [Antarcticirhabdus aurantiaca]
MARPNNLVDGAVVPLTDAEWAEYQERQNAPPAPTAPLGPISDRQFFQALALAPYSIITPQEALDAVKTGEIPQVMQAVIDQLPADRQFAATMLIAGGTEFVRDNDLVSVFGASQGMNAAQIDDFWRFAQGL